MSEAKPACQIQTYRHRLREEWAVIHTEIRQDIQNDLEAAFLAGQTAGEDQDKPLRIQIDPNTLYSRQSLLAMGMPRRLVTSIKAATVRRGQYMGSAVIAALEARASIASRHEAHPVKFRDGGRRHAVR